MNKFIEEILNNNDIMQFCFYEDKYKFDQEYINDSFKEIRTWCDDRMNFILDNIEVLYITHERHLTCLMDNKYIVYFDDEYSFFYMCHGFENIPEIIKKDEYDVKWLQAVAIKQNKDYDNSFVEYKQMCDKHNINPKLIINEQEFEDYLKSNGV